MSDDWFIKTKTGKRGPYSLAQLQRYVDAGAIRPNAGICDEHDQWHAAKTIAGLNFPDGPAVAAVNESESNKQNEEQAAQIQSLQSELAQRAESLNVREQTLSQRMQAAEQFEATAAELEAKRGDLEQRATELNAQVSQVELQEQELQTKAGDLESKSAELETRADELEIKTSELNATAEELQSQRQQLNEREQSLANREESLAEREEGLLEHEESLLEREATVDKAECELKEQRALLASQSAAAEDMDEQQKALQQDLSDLQTKWDAAQEELLVRTTQLETLREQYNEVVTAKLYDDDVGAVDDSHQVTQADVEADSHDAVLTERKRLLQEFASRQESLSQRESDLMRREDELTRRELDIATMETSLPASQDNVLVTASPKQVASPKQIEEQDGDLNPEQESTEQFASEEPEDSDDDPLELQSLPPLPSEMVQVDSDGRSLAVDQDHSGWRSESSGETKQERDEPIATSWEEVFGKGRASDEAELARELQSEAAVAQETDEPGDQPGDESKEQDFGDVLGAVTDAPLAIQNLITESMNSPEPDHSDRDGNGQDAPSGRTPLWEYRSSVFEDRLGPVYRVDEDDDPDMRVDVEIHHPDGEREFSTLVTNGMSDYPIPMPNGQRSVHAELLLYVTHVDELALRILRTAAKVPFQKKHGLSFGTTTSSDELAALMTESQHKDCVYLFPIIETDAKSIPGREFLSSSIQLFTLMTVTDAERSFIENTGIHKFQSLLEKNNHSIYFDLMRECYVRRKGWFRR